jgi:hypothetical protein
MILGQEEDIFLDLEKVDGKILNLAIQETILREIVSTLRGQYIVIEGIPEPANNL